MEKSTSIRTPEAIELHFVEPFPIVRRSSGHCGFMGSTKERRREAMSVSDGSFSPPQDNMRNSPFS
jgi:hypothetical protein